MKQRDHSSLRSQWGREHRPRGRDSVFLTQETRGMRELRTREEEVLKARGRVWKVVNGKAQSRSHDSRTE